MRRVNPRRILYDFVTFLYSLDIFRNMSYNPEEYTLYKGVII